MTVDVDGLRELLAAATPGNWYIDVDGAIRSEDTSPVAVGPYDGMIESADAQLIIALRNAAPELLNAAEERDEAYRWRDAALARCAALETALRDFLTVIDGWATVQTTQDALTALRQLIPLKQRTRVLLASTNGEET